MPVKQNVPMNITMSKIETRNILITDLGIVHLQETIWNEINKFISKGVQKKNKILWHWFKTRKQPT